MQSILMRARIARLVLVFFAIVSAPTAVRGECPSPVNPAEFLKCAAIHDPGLISARAELQALQGVAMSAGLWQNPELSGNMIANTEGQQKYGASLLQSLPLSGERGHASKEAQLKARAAEAEYQARLQGRLAEWVSQLVRLRQVTEELELLALQEELGQQALQRLGRLAILTAEQQAAKYTFGWNQKALEMSRLRLMTEQAVLRQEATVALGASPANWNFVIPHRQTWPEFPPESLKNSPQLLALKLGTDASESGYKRAKASAWPELGLGPIFEAEPGPTQQEYFAGGGLSLQLPLWNRSSGEKRAASAQWEASKTIFGSAENLLKTRLNAMQYQYQSAITALVHNANTVEEGVSALKTIKNSYLAGRLPVSAALEAFRQYFDAVEQNHALERKTLEILWQAYALTGTALMREP